MRQVSAITRLQALPSVFRGADLTLRFQWTSKTASQYLYLWKKRGLVRSLGGHSDVHANLLANPAPDWGKAVLIAMPSAVIIGLDALRQAGWSTQVTHRPVVAVNSTQPMYNVEPFEIAPRDPKWFSAVSEGIRGDRSQGLPVLRPAWALADMIHDHGWGKGGLWQDDIDPDEITKHDEADWQAACSAFSLKGMPLTELLSGSWNRDRQVDFSP